MLDQTWVSYDVLLMDTFHNTPAGREGQTGGLPKTPQKLPQVSLLASVACE